MASTSTVEYPSADQIIAAVKAIDRPGEGKKTTDAQDVKFIGVGRSTA